MNGTLMEQKNIIENIKKWNELDNQNRLLLEKQKQIREHKNVLTKNICNYLKQTNGSTITIMDDKIKYIERKEYSPLTFTYIQECLSDLLATILSTVTTHTWRIISSPLFRARVLLAIHSSNQPCDALPSQIIYVLRQIQHTIAISRQKAEYYCAVL